MIQELAKAHGKTAAQIILRRDIFDFELSEEEMDQIRDIDEQRRYEHW